LSYFFFSSRRRHTRSKRDWSSDVCSSDLGRIVSLFLNTWRWMRRRSETVSMTSSKPSIAQLREVCQPLDVLGRVSGEHWAGRLYMRHVSLYLTRALLPTRITPNGVTWLRSEERRVGKEWRRGWGGARG